MQLLSFICFTLMLSYSLEGVIGNNPYQEFKAESTTQATSFAGINGVVPWKAITSSPFAAESGYIGPPASNHSSQWIKVNFANLTSSLPAGIMTSSVTGLEVRTQICSHRSGKIEVHLSSLGNPLGIGDKTDFLSSSDNDTLSICHDVVLGGINKNFGLSATRTPLLPLLQRNFGLAIRISSTAHPPRGTNETHGLDPTKLDTFVYFLKGLKATLYYKQNCTLASIPGVTCGEGPDTNLISFPITVPGNLTLSASTVLVMFPQSYQEKGTPYLAVSGIAKLAGKVQIKYDFLPPFQEKWVLAQAIHLEGNFSSITGSINEKSKTGPLRLCEKIQSETEIVVGNKLSVVTTYTSTCGLPGAAIFGIIFTVFFFIGIFVGWFVYKKRKWQRAQQHLGSQLYDEDDDFEEMSSVNNSEIDARYEQAAKLIEAAPGSFVITDE